MKFTVYYEKPYWIGVLEYYDEQRFTVKKHIFGAEPKDKEVWDFTLYTLPELLNESAVGMPLQPTLQKRVSPKRLSRLAAKESRGKGIQTYAQEALNVALNQRKKERQVVSREQKAAHAAYKRQLKIAKKKEKHRGR
ncbi:hypothetical protein A374_13635 [Fictibacillus macauensis ZFHKF-1]|uniref:YjdF n=1 Tax=Fictibacillus macauensis ZFHKF-1 TaxID=1196324 RepID=I8AGD1_9BACL|nr:YjdF family protein [Fictibacillus macauensis]EIT84737.1 hypothetical protein A374_13635 [Fictibacillus macauensis ZFHKF-1]